MRSLIREVRRQPDHIREMITALCTITVVSFVALIWFQSFKSTTYALLNGEEPTQEQYFANNDPTSLFGYIGRAISEGRADLAAILAGEKEVIVEKHDVSSGPVHLLPVVKDK